MSRDLPADEFRSAMHRVADLVADYLEGVGERPVLPAVKPGEVRSVLPAAAPEQPEPLDTILDDYLRVIEPNLTHWNHPGFLAYFAITGSGPGILGETLAAGLNVNAMLWRTSPAGTELEERVCAWLARMMDLPADFHGHINDTASSSSLVALATARHRLPGLDVRVRGLSGRPEVPPLTLYASDQAHSSIDKSAIVLGLGQENVRRIETDADFRMSVPALTAAITRFRSLKLWMVIRAFGVEGLRERIREHCALARDLAGWIAADPRFELAAPVPFSTVCFRARLEEDPDRFNERLLARVNAAGPVFLSHTVLKGRYTLRVAIGNLRTEREHIQRLWELVGRAYEELRSE